MDARKYLAIDAAALVLYLVVAIPALTGIAVHEWLALGLLALFFVHAAVHAGWAIEAARGVRGGRSWVRTGNLVLDALMVVAFMTVTVSGLLISGSVLQALGLYAPGYYFWNPLHAVAAKALLALLLVHLAAHARQIGSLLGTAKGEQHEERSNR